MIEAEIDSRKYDPYDLNIAVPKGFYKEIDVTRFELEDNSINEEFRSQGSATPDYSKNRQTSRHESSD